MAFPLAQMIAFIALTIFVTSILDAKAFKVTSGSDAVTFDTIHLVLQWPPSYCINNKCNVPIKNDNFTIHGIWPEENGNEVVNCKGSDLRKSDVFNFKTELNKLWPSLQSGMSNFGFWSHEWKKHGTCTGWGHYDYFKFGLYRTWQHNIYSMLSNSNIHPGEKYTVSAIRAALNGLNLAPIIECNFNPALKMSQLYQIRLCLAISGNLDRCNGLTTSINCPSSAEIAFPV